LAIARLRDAARFCDALKPRCNIHAVPEDVMGLDNYVTDIDAHPESNPPVVRIAVVSSLMRVWNCAAARTASTALGNSAKNPSPVFFTMRPPWSLIADGKGQGGAGRSQGPRHPKSGHQAT
jgi:hypothetical protein